MARTTPAQKPRGEHSSTLSGGLPELPLFSGAIADEMRFRPPACQARAAKPLRFRGVNAYIPATFQSSIDDKGLVRKGGRGAEEIYPCKKRR